MTPSSPLPWPDSSRVYSWIVHVLNHQFDANLMIQNAHISRQVKILWNLKSTLTFLIAALRLMFTRRDHQRHINCMKWGLAWWQALINPRNCSCWLYWQKFSSISNFLFIWLFPRLARHQQSIMFETDRIALIKLWQFAPTHSRIAPKWTHKMWMFQKHLSLDIRRYLLSLVVYCGTWW